MARETLGAVRRRSRAPAAPKAPATSAGSSAPAPGTAGGRTGAPSATVTPEPAPADSPMVEPAAAPGTFPTRDDLVKAWGDGLLASLPNRARARFRVGRFVSVEHETAVYALPNETHRTYCEDVRAEVERALGVHFGVPVALRLVVDEDADDTGDPGAPPAGGTGAAPGAARRGAGGGGGRRAAPVEAAAEEPDQPDLLDPDVLAAETDLAGAGLTPEERLKQAFPGAQEL
jgi:hypothetical protein